MNLKADIKWIKAELNQVTDQHLIEAFKSLLMYRQKQVDKDWWDDLSETDKAEINEGIAQADKGELIPHEEVKKKYKKWL